MADRLEQRLVELAATVEFPPTPDLAPAVAARVARSPARPRRLVTARRSLVLALVALAVLAAVAGAVPGVRHALRDLFGLGGATVERVPQLPASPGGLELGRPVTLAQAREDAAFRLRVPYDPELGPPDATYLRGRPPLAQATLVYRPRRGLPTVEAGGAGLLLTEFRGDLEPDLVRKFIGPDTGTRRVRVGSATGFWVEGPHSFGYRDANGVVRIDQRRLASGTLLWRRGPVLLRLESELPLRRALEVARSVR